MIFDNLEKYLFSKQKYFHFCKNTIILKLILMIILMKRRKSNLSVSVLTDSLIASFSRCRVTIHSVIFCIRYYRFSVDCWLGLKISITAWLMEKMDLDLDFYWKLKSWLHEVGQWRNRKLLMLNIARIKREMAVDEAESVRWLYHVNISSRTSYWSWRHNVNFISSYLTFRYLGSLSI